MTSLSAAAASASSGILAGSIILVIGVLVAIGLYWLPTLIGCFRHVRDLGTVAVINGLLGWTLVGWVVALALAMRTPPPPQPAVLYGNDLIEPGPWPQPGQPTRLQNTTFPGTTTEGGQDQARPS